MKTTIRKRWANDVLVVGDSVVGAVHKGTGLDGEWFAYGCLTDWQDTPLGNHATERKARHAVERWVEEID